MRVRLIKIHERYRVLIGEQIYSSHKYEFAVIVSQFRFVTRNLFAHDKRVLVLYVCVCVVKLVTREHVCW